MKPQASSQASWKADARIELEQGVLFVTYSLLASAGRLQFDLWSATERVYARGRYGRAKWEALKQRIRRGGVRNSLLVAPMPTASTAQILGATPANHLTQLSRVSLKYPFSFSSI